MARIPLAWLHRVATRSLLFLLAPVAVLVHRATTSITTADQLSWFDYDESSLCSVEQPGCGALVHLARAACLAPPSVVAVIVLVSLLSGSHGRLLKFRYAKPFFFGALCVAFAPALVMVFRPASLLEHSTLWLMGCFVILLVWGALMALWVTDDATSKNRHEPHPKFRGVWERVSTLRLHIVVVLIYAIAILVLPQSSGQALDTFRSWGVASAGVAATTLLGISTCLLLSFCLRETAEKAEAVRAESANHDDKRGFDGAGWLVVGAFIVAAGGLLWWGPLGPGLLILGVVVVVLGALAVAPIPTAVEPTQSLTFLRWSGKVWRTVRLTTARLVRKLGGGGRTPVLDETPSSLSPLSEVLVAAPLLVVSTGLASVAFDTYWVDTTNRHVAATVTLAVTCLVLGAIMASTGQEPVTTALVAPKPTDAAPTRQTDVARSRPKRLAVAAVCLFLALCAPIFALTTRSAAVTLVVVIVTAVVPSAVYIWAMLTQRVSRGNWGSRLAVLAAVGTFVAVHVDPLTTGRVFGALTFLNVAGGLLVVLGAATLRLARDFRPPRALEWIGVKSPPVLVPLVVWWVLAGVSLPASMHDVELYPREPVRDSADVARTPTIADAFYSWVRAQPELASRVGGPTVPLVLVTAHGGGIRAAYWTALVLDCLVGHKVVKTSGRPDPPHACEGERRSPEDALSAARRIFVVSGVSGGSVGLAAYAENLLSGDPLEEGWVEDSLGHDFASPTIGWGIFHDLPNHLFGVSATSEECRPPVGSTCLRQDRARTLEQSLDGSTEDPPLLRTTWDQRSSPDPDVRARAESVPLLVFNSTLPGGRSAVVTSAAKLGQIRVSLSLTKRSRGTSLADSLPLGALETIDLMCTDKDIKISTAAFLSARFPVVSPSGRVAGSCDAMPGLQDEIVFTKICRDENDPCAMSMVDGGYLDNSGMLTMTSLLPEIKRLVAGYNTGPGPDVALFVVDIDSAYKTFDPSRVNPGQSAETFIPLSTAMVRGAVERFAKARAIRSLNQHCFFPITPALHPGLLAPLGWSLSSTTKDELHRALDDPERAGPAKSGPANNRIGNLKLIQRWLTPGRSQNAGQRYPMSDCALSPSGLALKGPERS